MAIWLSDQMTNFLWDLVKEIRIVEVSTTFLWKPYIISCSCVCCSFILMIHLLLILLGIVGILGPFMLFLYSMSFGISSPSLLRTAKSFDLLSGVKHKHKQRLNRVINDIGRISCRKTLSFRCLLSTISISDYVINYE